MIVHTHPFPINLKYGESFRIISFGDVHFGASDCATQRFEEDVIREHAKDKRAYFHSAGDLLDSIIVTDTKRFRQSGVDTRFRVDNAIDEMINEYVALWQKYKIPPERILGVTSGNHHDVYCKRTQTDVTERLAFALKTKNLGYSSFLRLVIHRDTARLPLVLFTHHGWGGGTRTEGGSMTKYAAHALTFPGARIYCYGHDHDCMAKDIALVKPNWDAGEQDDTTITVALCGSFKKTLSDGAFPSYSEVGGMKPKKLGHITFDVKHYEKSLTMSGKRQRHEGLSVRTMWDHNVA